MKENKATAAQMAKNNENENADNRKQIQQVMNDATILCRKVARLRYNFDGDGEDRRQMAIRKASNAIETAIEALGTLYGYEVISRAMNAIDCDDDITDDEAEEILNA